MDSNTYAVVAPIGRTRDTAVLTQPEPLEGLSSRTVGEFWNYLFGGDIMFPLLRKELQGRFVDVRFVEYSVFGNTHGPEEADVVRELPRLMRLHHVDAVVSGIGC